MTAISTARRTAAALRRRLQAVFGSLPEFQICSAGHFRAHATSTESEYVVIACLLGGVLTLGLIMLRRNPLPPMLAKLPWFLRLADRASGVPYGVALALAALHVLPDTDVFQLAAIS